MWRTREVWERVRKTKPQEVTLRKRKERVRIGSAYSARDQ